MIIQLIRKTAVVTMNIEELARFLATYESKMVDIVPPATLAMTNGTKVRKPHKKHKRHAFPKVCEICKKTFAGRAGIGVHAAWHRKKTSTQAPGTSIFGSQPIQ